MAQLSNFCRKVFLNPIRRNGQMCCARLVSTSEKKNEAGKMCEPGQSVYKKVPDFSNPNADNKNWISYGFVKDDEGHDKFRGRRDWARREAFIRLHEREQLGLEPIDPNYIDPKLIILPPDEELSEEDIVI